MRGIALLGAAVLLATGFLVAPSCAAFETAAETDVTPDTGGPSVPDATDAADAGSTETSDSEAPRRSPCGGDFAADCDDFERGDPTTAFGWSRHGDGADVVIDARDSTSPTRSLVIGLKGQWNKKGYLARPLQKSLRTLRVSFAMRADVQAPYTQAVSVRLTEEGTAEMFVHMNVEEDGVTLSEQDFRGGPSTVQSSAKSAALGPEFHRYELAIDLDTKAVRLRRDGALFEQMTLQRPYEPTVDFATLRVGAAYTTDGGTAELRFDDIGVLQK